MKSLFASHESPTSEGACDMCGHLESEHRVGKTDAFGGYCCAYVGVGGAGFGAWCQCPGFEERDAVAPIPKEELDRWERETGEHRNSYPLDADEYHALATRGDTTSPTSSSAYLGECIECSEGFHSRCDGRDCPCGCRT